jgi:hypothetical protein
MAKNDPLWSLTEIRENDRYELNCGDCNLSDGHCQKSSNPAAAFRLPFQMTFADEFLQLLDYTKPKLTRIRMLIDEAKTFVPPPVWLQKKSEN